MNDVLTNDEVLALLKLAVQDARELNSVALQAALKLTQAETLPF